MEPTTKGYSPEVKQRAQSFIESDRMKLEGILGKAGETKLGLTEARPRLTEAFKVDGNVAEAIYHLWHGEAVGP